MAITLGGITFDEAHTTVEDRIEEVGGRDERVILVSGLIVGASTAEEITARLDAIVRAASEHDYSVALSVREGRRIWVRRNAFKREVASSPLAGSFVLELCAKDALEEAVEEQTAAWSISASGATKAVTSAGTAFATAQLTLVAEGPVVQPSYGDGARTILYDGIVGDGETLVFDGKSGKVLLNGEDVTPYSTGEFPRLEPGETTLIYEDAASSSHTAEATIAYRDRWW